MLIDDYGERHTPFDGCFNFRDIGGYPVADGRTVRWGHYFRAGRQDRMTSGDLEGLAALEVKTQIDPDSSTLLVAFASGRRRSTTSRCGGRSCTPSSTRASTEPGRTPGRTMSPTAWSGAASRIISAMSDGCSSWDAAR